MLQTMIKKLTLLLVSILSFGFGYAADIKLDFSTPEGAILMLEDAYKKKDIEAAVSAQDFLAQARVMHANTAIEIRLGDRVMYRHLLIGRSQGVVAYLPGVSKVNPRIIENQWVVRLTNGKGVFMLHSDELEYAHKRVIFLARGESDSEITADEDV